MPAQVTVRSVPGAKFTHAVDTGRHQLFGDEPESHGGADRGPNPYEWLLGALGT